MSEENASRRPTGRFIVLVIALVAVIGGGLVAWEVWLEDRFLPKRWGVVEDGKIYRSGQLSETLVRETLERHGIEVVVDLTGQRDGGPDVEAEIDAIRDLGIESVLVRLDGDGTGEVGEYAKAIAAIHESVEAGKPVLVHCAAGAQRTGGAVAAYRVLVQGRSPEEAVDEMESYAWDRRKDTIVLEYLNENMAELASLLVEAGVIEEVPERIPVLEP